MLRSKTRWTAASAFVLLLVGVAVAFARPHRRHTANSVQPLRLVPADQSPPAQSVVSIDEGERRRRIQANGIPQHSVGAFPNRGNPNRIREQRHRLGVPSDPKIARRVTPIIPEGRGRPLHVFGFCVNGVPLEPGAGEWWQGWPRSGWTYEPLGGAIPLGLDENHAHVQPTGKYHYHGLPTGLLERLDWSDDRHSPLVGWAADGFPIYAVYGYADPDDAESEIVALRPSYRLRQGERPGGGGVSSESGPGGRYDGTFVQDYEHLAGVGDLDECNGRECVTPDFPDGTYAYFLTEEWPVIPRHFRGEPAVRR